MRSRVVSLMEHVSFFPPLLLVGSIDHLLCRPCCDIFAYLDILDRCIEREGGKKDITVLLFIVYNVGGRSNTVRSLPPPLLPPTPFDICIFNKKKKSKSVRREEKSLDRIVIRFYWKCTTQRSLSWWANYARGCWRETVIDHGPKYLIPSRSGGNQ